MTCILVTIQVLYYHRIIICTLIITDIWFFTRILVYNDLVIELLRKVSLIWLMMLYFEELINRYIYTVLK